MIDVYLKMKNDIPDIESKCPQKCAPYFISKVLYFAIPGGNSFYYFKCLGIDNHLGTC
jgi:hypothetical protein